MKTTGIAIASLLFLSAGSMFAQTGGLTVKKGATYSFDSKVQGKMTQSVNGQENSNELKNMEKIKLTPTKVEKGRIEWDCATSDPTAAKGKGDMLKMVTDASGKILEVIGGEKGATVSAGKMSVKVGSAKSRLSRFFLPQLTAAIKPGDSWDDTADDSTTVGQIGLTIHSHIVTRYTFDGYADTLGVKTARVRWESTGMEINGESSNPQMSLTVVGEGNTSGVAYYSTTDGLLVSRNESLDARLRLNVQQMIIPVVQQQTTTTVRVKG
jgi:hypothetical protein